MRAIGCIGIAMPWGRAYIIPEYYDDEMMHVHELQHLEQIKRDGAIWFLVKYFGLYLRHGYADHPYEIEARQRAEFGATHAEVVAEGLKRPAWMASSEVSPSPALLDSVNRTG